MKKKKKYQIFTFSSYISSFEKNEILNTLKFIQSKKLSSLMHVTKVLESPYEIIKKKK